MKTPRTDCHRPAAIKPRDYTVYTYYFLSPYVREDGTVFPGPGVESAQEVMRSTLVFTHDSGTRSRLGKCDVCGANFKEGAILRHDLRTFINVGHDCADKYQIQADWTDLELAAERHRIAEKAAKTAARNKARKEAFITQHPEIIPIQDYVVSMSDARLYAMSEFKRSAFGTLSSIIHQMDQRDLSEAQIAACQRIHSMLTEVPKSYTVESKVTAPLGRQTFQGVVIAVKAMEGNFGWSNKATIKVSTPDGVWMAWGTVPDSVDAEGLKGKSVVLTGTLKPGREPSFAFYSRPSNFAVLETA